MLQVAVTAKRCATGELQRPRVSFGFSRAQVQHFEKSHRNETLRHSALSQPGATKTAALSASGTNTHTRTPLPLSCFYWQIFVQVRKLSQRCTCPSFPLRSVGQKYCCLICDRTDVCKFSVYATPMHVRLSGVTVL